MINKKLFATAFAVALIAGGVAFLAPAPAEAVSITTYANKKCSGGTLAGSVTQSTNSCVSYCQGLTASCCTTNSVNSDLNGQSYICSAYTGTTATVTQNPTNQCSGGAEPMCTYRTWTASVIDYTAAQATASLVANPTTISSSQSSILTWSSTGATSCTGTNFSTGGATSGSVTVSPSTSTSYSVSCTNGGSTATASAFVTVNIFTVSCAANTQVGVINAPLTWSGSATGGPGAYTYSWSGTDGLSQTATTSFQKTYTTSGLKTATLTVTSGALTIAAQCTGVACQTASCGCSGTNCGPVIIEGEGPDIVGGTPSLVSGAQTAGATLTFGSTIINVGNVKVDEYLQNRFQIDLNNNGTWDTNLDVLGTTQNFVKFYPGKMCSGGTLVPAQSGSDTQDATIGNAGGEAQANCTSSTDGNLQSGQCCQTKYRIGTAAPPATNYTYFDWSVYSGAWSLVTEVQPSVACPAGSYCSAGVWLTGTGTRAVVPVGTVSTTITSPTWTATPGTHGVRFCPDQPGLTFEESNETNNCGPTFTLTIAGPDFTASTPNVNSGQLTAGQTVTFYSTVTNTGTVNHTGTVNNQCQIDLNNNGTWDVTTAATFTNLNAGATTQPVCAGWTAVTGTHAVRFCADTGGAVAEVDENNNCSATGLVFTVTPPTQCGDGIDNNSNGLTDLADPACSSSGDTTEESHPAAGLSITSSKNTVKRGETVTLTWAATEVVPGSCSITSSVGDSWTLSGGGGTQVSNPITTETTYTLRCNNMQQAVAVTANTRVRIAPIYEEI